MACNFSIRCIILEEPNATPNLNPLNDSVLEGPIIEMIFSGSISLCAQRCIYSLLSKTCRAYNWSIIIVTLYCWASLAIFLISIEEYIMPVGLLGLDNRKSFTHFLKDSSS